MNNRGYQLRDLMPIALVFVVATIAMSIGADVIDNVQEGYVNDSDADGCNSTNTTGCGWAYNASENGLEAMDELGSWLPTLTLVVAAAIIIGVLVYSLAMR